MQADRTHALEERESAYHAKKKLDKGLQALKAALASNLTTVGSLFGMWDVNGDGQISEREFVAAMDALAVPGVGPGCAAALFRVGSSADDARRARQADRGLHPRRVGLAGLADG